MIKYEKRFIFLLFLNFLLVFPSHIRKKIFVFIHNKSIEEITKKDCINCCFHLSNEN